MAALEMKTISRSIVWSAAVAGLVTLLAACDARQQTADIELPTPVPTFAAVPTAPPTVAAAAAEESVNVEELADMDQAAAPMYQIDFVADPPVIERQNDQRAVITGNVLRQADLAPAGLPYTITIDIAGGPVNQEAVVFPPLAGRGPARFVDRQQPMIGAEGGLDVLTIRLLGSTGESDNPTQGQGRTFYRDPSTEALVTLTLGDSYALSNVRYTLTDIDMALDGDVCAAAEPNNYACGEAFIDRVDVLSSGGRNVYRPVNGEQIALVGDVITARFADTDNSGRPDGIEDRRLSSDSDQGNIEVFHPTEIGAQLQFRFSDAGEGIDGDADGYHDFDATEQGIGLASGITFDAEKLPPPPPPTPDPNLTKVEGLVFGDRDGDGVQGEDETGLPGITMALYTGDGISQRKIMTTTTGMEGDETGRYLLGNLQAGEAYRLEAHLTMPQLADGGDLNPIRLIERFTPTVAGPNRADFGAWPFLLAEAGTNDSAATDPAATDDAASLAASGLLLPDLQPLTHYPLPDDLDEGVKEDVARGYPGLEGWYLDTDSQPGRLLLRFGTLALNQGEGPLHILGGLIEGDTRPVYQRIYTPSGAFVERLVGEFEQHEGHDHVHVAAFELYNLRDRTTDALVASGPKVSFCLTDVLWPIEPELTAAAPVGTVPMGWSCGAYEQSINVGFSDYYGPALPDQWIDITDVPDGSYWLEVVVNPDNRLLESDMSNNTVRIPVEIDNPLH